MDVKMATVHEVKSGKHGMVRESDSIRDSESESGGRYLPMKGDGCEGSAVPMNGWYKGNGSIPRATDWGMGTVGRGHGKRGGGKDNQTYRG